MIPEFDDNGNLPPGIHRATLDEIEERFGRESEIRRVEMESLGWLVEAAVRAGVERIVINGSFVTDVLEPNDVDCVVLPGPSVSLDAMAGEKLFGGLPFLDVHVVDQVAFDWLVGSFFAASRDFTPKGMIGVIL